MRALDDALRRPVGPDIRVAGDLAELAGNFRGGEPEVDRARHHRAAGHALVRGRFVLRERDAARRLDLVHPQRAVAAGARENDGDRLVLLVVRQRFEKQVDRMMAPVDLVARDQFERSLRDDHVRVRRNHIHAIRLDLRLVFDFIYRQLRRAGQDLGQVARVRRRQVGDEDERHAGVGWQRAQQLRECLEAAGGRADADNRKRECGLWNGVLDGFRLGIDGRGRGFRHPPECLIPRSCHKTVESNWLQSSCLCRASRVGRTRRRSRTRSTGSGRQALACESHARRVFPWRVLRPSCAKAVNHQPRRSFSIIANTKRRPSARISGSPDCGVRTPCSVVTKQSIEGGFR